jgi:hypothetical protein
VTAELIENWERFTGILKRYGRGLNPPCAPAQIRETEQQLNYELPLMLKTLLSLNNGQLMDAVGIKNGIFKSLSGWGVYERHIFLDIAGIQTAYQVFCGDGVLLAEFGRDEIPFAVAGKPERYKEAFCIHWLTGSISLIWTDYVDPFNPPEWQVQLFPRAGTLAQFVQKQIELY